MSQVTVSFVDQLANTFPGLRSIYDEHVAANFGEVLPHVFFGDLMPYLVDLFVQSRRRETGGPAELQVRGILNALEEAYVAGPVEVQDLVAVSFLENLPRSGEVGSPIRDWLGPRLQAQLRAIG